MAQKKIKFLQDYRGTLTAEAFFEKGDVDVFDASVADQLIAANRATEVKASKSAGSQNKAKTSKK